MSRLSIKRRLVVMFSVLLALIVLSVGYGMHNARQSSVTLGSLYSDRVVPLKQLKEVADGYAVGIADAAHKVRDGSFTAEQGLSAISQARQQIDRSWRAYVGTELIPLERELIGKAQKMFIPADGAAEKLATLITSNDMDGLKAYAAKEMYQPSTPCRTSSQR